MPELSVVIPTYRRHHALARTLDALERQSAPLDALEVLVVDDPRDDDIAAVAGAVAAPRRAFAVRQLHREAPGVSAARNVGWRAARAPVVLFLGDDILAAADLVARHLDWHRHHPEEGLAVLGHVRWATELRLTPFMRWLEHGIQFDFGSLPGDQASWAHFYTANVSVKRALLERAGGFDEQRFPFLYEDLDLGRRLADHGLDLRYDRAAVGEHLHQTGVPEWRRRMAATARAERRWVALRPEMPAWFHDRFAAAERRPRVPAAAGRLAARVPHGLPVLGPRAFAVADLHFRQQLAPAFLEAWRAEEETADPRPSTDDEPGVAQGASASSGGSSPGGPK